MINEIEQIFSLLRRINGTNNFSIAKHIALATRSKDTYHLTNKQFLEILEKYELEINFDETVESPEVLDKDIDSIVKDGMNFEKLVEDIIYNEEDGS